MKAILCHPAKNNILKTPCHTTYNFASKLTFKITYKKYISLNMHIQRQKAYKTQ